VILYKSAASKAEKDVLLIKEENSQIATIIPNIKRNFIDNVRGYLRITYIDTSNERKPPIRY
jgi:hypothetical protein